MPESKNEITREYITFSFQGEWYCIPFTILMEEREFMSLIGNHFLTLDTDDIEYVFKVCHYIYIYLTNMAVGENAYTKLSNLISANIEHWQPILNTCKLYNQ